MRLALFIIAMNLSIPAFCYPQTTKVSLNMKDATLKEVFREIEKQSEYVFFYYEDILNNGKVSIEVKDQPVSSVLDNVLKGKNITYTIYEGQISLSKKKEILPVENQQRPPADVKTVKGRVSDNQDEPLVGVSIQVKGTTNGSVTDMNGDYVLSNLSDNAVLVFSYIGYTTQEIAIGNRTTINVILNEEIQDIEEVVVVAYGIQKKVSVTGAVASVQTKELKQSSSANLSAALAGRLSGLTVLQSSGQPGYDAVSLYLRGVGTTNGANPLILIDGVPRDNINILDPNEIASVSILKDASATAVFGVRGANGVILITTLRGTAGKSELSVSADYSLQGFLARPDRIHSWEFAEMRNQASRNSGVTEENMPYTPYMIEMYKSGADRVFYPDRDTYHDLFRDWAPQTRVNANMNGGSDKMQYFVNAGYIGQGGQFNMEPKSLLGYDASFKMNRYNFRGNVDYMLAGKLKLSLNLASYIEKVNTPQFSASYNNDMGTMVSQAMAFGWSIPPTDPGPLTVNGYGVPPGQITTQTGVGGSSMYGTLNRMGYCQTTRGILNSSFAMDWNLNFITKGLTTKFMISYDTNASSQLQGIRSYDTYGFVVARTPEETSSFYGIQLNQDESIRLRKNTGSYYYMNLQYSINYARQFGKHDVTGMVLVQRDNWEDKGYGADLPYNVVGFSERTTYAFDNRYLAEVNVGYNGSEQFAQSNRFGFFPAFSGGWVISNEEFLRDNKLLNHLKLRASYGKVGNDKLGSARFLYLSSINESAGGRISTLNYGKYVSIGKVGNEKLSWEIARKQNYGLDFQILNVLSASIDVFYEKRDGILINRGTVPIIQGISLDYLPKMNMGKVKNQGYEIELTYRKQIDKDLSLTVKGNYAYNENKALFLDEAKLTDDYAYQYRQTGYNLGQHWGYKIDYSNGNGYINTPEELANLPVYNVGGTPRLGDFKYVDVTGDGVVDEKDKIPLGYPTVPHINYGFSGNISYKGIDFAFLFTGIAKSNIEHLTWGATEYGLTGFFSGYHKQSWTEERYRNGESIRYPALGLSAGTSQKVNDFFLFDKSFLRLKTVELGYSLPEKWIQPLKINRARVYLNGNNLLTFKKMPLNVIDPEQTSMLVYPIVKMINIGLNVVF
ncbi:MAG: TonB-dependent receptor [Tannerella sp.]|nr:TonB-dependent receptor [Tannerella sp.]